MSIIKSRENLQILSQQNYGSRALKYEEIDKFLDTLWHDMRFTFGAGYREVPNLSTPLLEGSA